MSEVVCLAQMYVVVQVVKTIYTVRNSQPAMRTLPIKVQKKIERP